MRIGINRRKVLLRIRKACAQNIQDYAASLHVHIFHGPPGVILSMEAYSVSLGQLSHESWTTTAETPTPLLTEWQGGLEVSGHRALFSHPLMPMTSTSIETSNKLARINLIFIEGP